MTRILILSAVTLLLTSAAPGVTAAMQAEARTPQVLGARIVPHWDDSWSGFWYRRERLDRPAQFFHVDAHTGERRELDAPPPAPPLQEERSVRRSGRGGEETRLTFRNHTKRALKLHWVRPDGVRESRGNIPAGGSQQQHTYSGHRWVLTAEDGSDVAAYTATAAPAEAIITSETRKPQPTPRAASAETRAPRTLGSRGNGGFVAVVRDHNLWLIKPDGEEVQLSQDATSEHSFHRDTTRRRAMGMSYSYPEAPADEPRVHWSPDGRFVLAEQTTVVPEPRVTLVESSPEDSLLPKVHTYPYIKPGDPIPQANLRLFETATGRELNVDASLMANPWQIDRIRWSADSRRVLLRYNQRGHQLLRVIAIDLEGDTEPTAATRVLVEERSKTFIDYSSKSVLRVLKDGDLLWASERDGWNHLYRIPSDGDGALQLTQGSWNVRSIEHIDDEFVTFWAVGRVEGQDPYYRQLCRVRLSGGEVIPLTSGDGDHSVQWAPDRSVFIDSWSRVDQPPMHALRSGADGTELLRFEDATVTGLEAAGRRLPERVRAAGRDGRTPIYGMIHYPTHFDPKLSYPVIECIYAGPHSAFVPKAFRLEYRSIQELNDLGFVVVRIDGMGTNWRGKAFHDIAWKNLKDAGLPDRIAWMRAAAAERPWIDLSRVGIYGGSAGGQNAMRAVLDHADFYRAAAADCGCHDNRMDKIWWNEQWLGLPGDGSYVANSNVEDAHKLGGALLLTVGELDRNVDPSSTYQVVDALRRAGKDFEFLLLPGMGHGAGESSYGRKRRSDFFVRHLGAPIAR